MYISNEEFLMYLHICELSNVKAMINKLKIKKIKSENQNIPLLYSGIMMSLC